MTRFSTSLSTLPDLDQALDCALRAARASFGEDQPKLAVVFASAKYPGIDTIAASLRQRLPGVPFVGGTSAGALFDSDHYAEVGVSVSLIGGVDLEATTRAVRVATTDALEVAVAARSLRLIGDVHATAGRGELLCLALAPSRGHIGDTLVAALKKGASANAQLAGALVSTEGETAGGLVWSDVGGVSDRDVVVAGIFTERPLGVSARHGWTPLGSAHRVTGSDGDRLISLDGRPALDVWLDEARAHGANLPQDATLAMYLASHYEVAILGTEGLFGGECIVRGSRLIHPDGSVELFGSIPEGAEVRLVTATSDTLFAAASMAAQRALENVDGRAVGALCVACVGRMMKLGEAYRAEPRSIAETFGAPLAGTIVNGEIALNRRDGNGFHNSSVTVIAFPE